MCSHLQLFCCEVLVICVPICDCFFGLLKSLSATFPSRRGSSLHFIFFCWAADVPFHHILHHADPHFILHRYTLSVEERICSTLWTTTGSQLHQFQRPFKSSTRRNFSHQPPSSQCIFHGMNIIQIILVEELQGFIPRHALTPMQTCEKH
jgi:hypothetical protein